MNILFLDIALNPTDVFRHHNVIELFREDDDVFEEKGLPLDLSYMLHVILNSDSDEMDISTLYWRTADSIDTEEGEDKVGKNIWNGRAR